MLTNFTKYIYTVFGLFGASLAIAAPINDNPCQAIALTPTLACSYASYTNAAATGTTGVTAPGCASYSATDVWFSVVVPANGQITVDMQTGGMTDSGLAMYAGTCGALSLLACDDDTGAGSMSQLSIGCLAPGSTVFLRVWSYGTSATGTFGICVTSPSTGGGALANDNACGAIPLTINSACNYISTTNVGASCSATSSCGVGLQNDIWYSTTVAANGILVFDSSPGTLTNTGVAFYTGSCGSLTEVACNDNGSHTGASMSYLYKTGLTPGSTLYIRVWGQSGATGTFGFCVSTPPIATSLTPASDACSAATPICDFNGYQGNTSSAYTTAGPAPTASNTGINGFCGVIDNNSWLKFTAAATTASFNVFVTGCTSQSGGAASGGIQMAMYSTTCGAANTFTRVSNCVNDANFDGNPNGFVITANSLTIGNQYVMMIDGYAGDVCNYTIGANGGVDVISIASSVASKVVCPGASTTLTVDAVGTGPFVYTWAANPTLSATNTANPTATPTVTTTYTVTVTGGNCGAQQTASVTIIVPNPTLTMTSATATCGSGNGTATVAPSAISGVTYTYLWNAAAQTTTTATNLAAATYTVTVTSTGGCTKTASVTVASTTPPTAAITGTPAFCVGSNTMLTANGGGTYAWTGGSTLAALSVSAAGTYTVTVTAANGCTATQSSNVAANILPTPSLSANTITCTTTAATLTASGGANYAFSANATSPSGTTATAPTATTYTVTVTHSNSCTASTTVLVTQNTTPPAAGLTADGILTCTNTNVNLTATNGTTYAWSANATNVSGSAATASASGNYTITATSSSNGCTAAATVAVTQNITTPTINITLTPTVLTCTNLTTNITVSGGNTYAWTGGTIASGVNAATVNVSAPATYTVVVTNTTNGCSATSGIAVTQNITPPVPSIAAPAVLTCSLTSTNLVASGGSSYLWSGNVVSSSGATATVNIPTTYIVTATAANGCIASTTVLVTQNITLPAAIASSTGNPCPSTPLSLSAMPNGAANYAWSGPNSYTNATPNPSVSASATAAMMGTYTVTVTGTNGCSATATTAMTLLVAPTTSTPVKSCNVAGTFYTYRFNIVTGTPAPTVTDNMSIGGSISGGAFISNPIPVASLPNFTVTNTCGSVIMTPPNTPCSATADCSGTIGCFGSNLAANVDFSLGYNGFTSTYTPNWGGSGNCSPGSNNCNSGVAVHPYYASGTADILCQGTFGIDANVRQCNKFWSPNIHDHTTGSGKMMMVDFPATYNAATNKIWCENIALAAATDYCFGGYFINLIPAGTGYTAPVFGFSLGGVAFTNTVTVAEDEQWHSNGVQFRNTTAATYTLCINNLNAGGTGFDVGIDDISIKTINTGTIPNTTNDVKVLCAGQTSVIVPVLINDLSGTGTLLNSTLKITTTPAFSDGYISNINTTTGEITFTPYATFYTTGGNTANFEYQICNTGGCCATASVTINAGSNPTATVAATGGNTLCSGTPKNVSLSTVTGGSGSGYSYLWSNAATTISTSVLPMVSPTTYTATVTDGAGCSITATLALTINPLPTAIGGANATICNNASAALNATATGGTTPYNTYTWNDAGANPHNVNPSISTTYSVTISDANGCTGTSTTRIIVNPRPTASITGGGSAICRNVSTSLVASAIGGSGTFNTYVWDNSLSAVANQNVAPTANTIYNVTITDTNNCASSSNVTVTVNALPLPDAGASRSICAGGNTTLSASSSGGSGAGYTYNWGAVLGIGASKTVSPAANTTYTVTVTDGNGCQSSTAVTITVNAVAPASLASTSVQYCTGKTATITCSNTGTYVWSNGASAASIVVSPATVTTYTVTVTDSNNCLSSASATVTPNVNPLPSVAPVVSAFCSGGSATISSVAAFSSYLWSNASTAQSVAVTSGGIYTVTVTNAQGCTGTASRNVLQNPLPVFSITGTLAFCQGAMTTLSETGDAGAYLWNTNATTQSISVSNANNYTVTVTNSNGCQSTRSVTTVVNPLPNPSILGNGSFCFGGNSLLDAGAFASYQWSNTGGIIGGATIQTYSATLPDTYTVWVTNSLGCSATDARVITRNANITPNISGATAICAGASTALNAGSYNNYGWSDSGGTIAAAAGQPILTVSTAGAYTVTVTDIAGCTGTNAITITANANPTVAITGAGAFCTNTNITLSVLSGFTDINWSNGFNGAANTAITVSTPNTYLVTVTDANGCTATSNRVVIENVLPTAAISGATAFCQAASTTLTASGGAATYNYAWSGTGATTAAIVITTTPPTTYTVTVTNAATLCSATATSDVTVNPLPTPVITTTTGTNAFCAGSTIGLGLVATGGLTAYQWSNASGAIVSTAANYSTNIAGIYTVTVTNTFGCTANTTITVTQNTNPTPGINAGATAAAFCQNNNVMLTASGGNTYMWSTGATAAAISVGAINTYTVTITSTATSCTASRTITVTQNTLPTATISGMVAYCTGKSTTITASGAGVGGTYLWSTAATTAALPISGTPAAAYTVTVTDANGCTASRTTVITLYTNPIATVSNNGTPQTAAFCSGKNIMLTAPAGLTTYAWANSTGIIAAQTANTYTVAAAGTYTVTITNSNGCTGTSTAAIIQNNLPTASITAPTAFCAGSNVSLSANAGVGLGYNWSTLSTTPTISVTPSTTTTYTVTVTIMATGCTDVATQLLSQNALPSPSVIGATTYCSGSITTLTAAGGNAYIWSNGSGNDIATINSPTVGTSIYTVTITSAQSCSTSSTVVVTVSPTPSATINTTGSATAFCTGTPLTLTAPSGMTTYAWSDGTGGQTISPLTGGTYTVVITNSSACTASTSIALSQNALPTANANINTGATTAAFCTNSTGATLCLPTGILGNWSNSINNSNCITVTNPATYIVTVTNAQGCTATDAIAVSQNALPSPAITGATSFCAGTIGTTLTASGGSGTFSYTWSDGTSAATTAVNNLTSSPTNYSVTVTNTSTNCVATTNVAVTQLAQPSTTISATSSSSIANSFCTNGSAALTVATGLSAYTWYLNGTAIAGASNSITANTVGNYTVLITNSVGCTNTASLVLTQNALPTASINVNGSVGVSTAAFCRNGNLLLTATGGGTYAWSNSTNTATNTVNSATTYTVSVTNAASCVSTASVVVTENVLPNVAISGATAYCATANTTLTASGGTTFVWKNGANTTIGNAAALLISGVPSNPYTVQVTDGNGCQSSSTVSVTANALPTPAITTNTNRFAFCENGTVTLDGGSFLSYLWSNTPATTVRNLTVSTQGDYTVTVTDGNGCTGVVTQFIQQNLNPIPTITTNPNSTAFCAGASVQLTANALNTTQYQWSNNILGANITVAPTGNTTYTVTITDNNTCIGSQNITLTQNPLPVIAITNATNNAASFCIGGGINLSASGGATYQWSSPNAVGAILNATSAGLYTVTVTTAQGCVSTSRVTVFQNALPTADIIAVNNVFVICGGAPIVLSANGTGISYTWSAGAIPTAPNSNTATVAAAGNYTVTVTNAQGCSFITAKSVTAQSNPTVGSSGNTAFCPNGGSTTVTLTGGTNYSWTGGSAPTSAANTFSVSGNYMATVTDAAGCKSTTLVAVSQSTNPTPSIQITNNAILCDGQTVVLNAGIGGNATDTYAWANGNTSLVGTAVTQTVSGSGNYFVTVTNAVGCTGTANRSINSNTSPNIGITGASASPNFCAGTNTVLTATSGLNNYIWSNQATNVNTITVTIGGIYTVTASNGSGCTATATVNVLEKPLPVVGIQAINEFCKGKTVLMQATGMSGVYSWSGGGSSSTKTTTLPGTYTVIVLGANGCTNSATHVLVQNALPRPNAGADFSAYPNALFQLNATGGGDYQWSQPTAGTGNTLLNLTDYNPTGVLYDTQTYTVTVTDAKGCTASDEITITLGEVLECLGQSEGITPNGDGYNDTWGIGCLGYFANTVQIFNRWGQPLLTASNYGHPGTPVWDATENGIPVPDGTYYYIITIVTKDANKNSVYKGNVTIIR